MKFILLTNMTNLVFLNVYKLTHYNFYEDSMKYLRKSLLAAFMVSSITSLFAMDGVGDTLPLFHTDGQAFLLRRRKDLDLFWEYEAMRGHLARRWDMHDGQARWRLLRWGLLNELHHARRRIKAVADEQPMQDDAIEMLVQSMIHVSRVKEVSELLLSSAVANERKKILELMNESTGGFLTIVISGQPGTGKASFAKTLIPPFWEYIDFDAGTLCGLSTAEIKLLLGRLLLVTETVPCVKAIIIRDAGSSLGEHAEDSPKKKMFFDFVQNYLVKKGRNCHIILLTHRKQDFKREIQDARTHHIHIDAPNQEQRRAILGYYVDRMLIDATNLDRTAFSLFSWQYWFEKKQAPLPVIEKEAFSQEQLDDIARRFRGFTGRELKALVRNILRAAVSRGTQITHALVTNMVNEALAAKAEFEERMNLLI